MNTIACKLTGKLVQMRIIKEEDWDIYLYGIRQGIVLLYNTVVVLAVSLLFQMVLQSLVFTVAYGLLRTTAGGYHARTQRNCNILSVILIITVLSILKWVPWSTSACIALSVLSGIIVFCLAPVEDENKPLDAKEKTVYKKRVRVVLCAIMAVFVAFLIIGSITITSCIALSVFFAAFMLVMGSIKNKLRES